jgi:hypothetical protein
LLRSDCQLLRSDHCALVSQRGLLRSECHAALSQQVLCPLPLSQHLLCRVLLRGHALALFLALVLVLVLGLALALVLGLGCGLRFFLLFLFLFLICFFLTFFSAFASCASNQSSISFDVGTVAALSLQHCRHHLRHWPPALQCSTERCSLVHLPHHVPGDLSSGMTACWVLAGLIAA